MVALHIWQVVMTLEQVCDVQSRRNRTLSLCCMRPPAACAGHELLVAKDIEKTTPGALEYDDYLTFLDAASIACIECEGYQRVVQ